MSLKVNKTRVVLRFIIVTFILMFTISQFFTLFYLIIVHPTRAYLLTSVVTISLPASIGVLGAYVGIESAKMKKGYD